MNHIPALPCSCVFQISPPLDCYPLLSQAFTPSTVLAIIDRAIQTYGGAGIGDTTPLAHMWAGARTLRLADGPDIVHLEQIARLELAAQMQGGRRARL